MQRRKFRVHLAELARGEGLLTRVLEKEGGVPSRKGVRHGTIVERGNRHHDPPGKGGGGYEKGASLIFMRGGSHSFEEKRKRILGVENSLKGAKTEKMGITKKLPRLMI